MDRAEAIDSLCYLIADVQRYRRRELTGEFTAQDVERTVRAVLADLIGADPTAADCREVMDG